MIPEEILSRFAESAPLAETITHLRVSFADGSEPQLNKCHENVARYLAESGRGTAVRGWLVTSGFLFHKHTALRDNRGDLFDITPLRAPTLFVEHPGDEEEFWSLPNQFSLLGF